MLSGRAGLWRIESGYLAPGDRLRLAIRLLARLQHPLDMLQLLVKLPTVVARQLIDRGGIGRSVRIGADCRPATGTAERLLLARRKRRHILAALLHHIVFLESASRLVNYTVFAGFNMREDEVQ